MDGKVSVIVSIPVAELGSQLSDGSRTVLVKSHKVENGYSTESLVVIVAPDGVSFAVRSADIIHAAKICVGLPS